MDIDLHHKCKPESLGDDQPEVNIDMMSVWIKTESGRVSLTHDQFKEVVRAYNGYVQANIVAQEQIKE